MPIGLETRLGMGQKFSPDKIDGLKIWLDATDPATITASGFDVSDWLDKSGEGNDVAQVTMANQPITGGNINGRNAITFDGVNDFLQRTTFTGGELAQPNTVFTVCELVALPGDFGKIIDGGVDLKRHIVEVMPDDSWSMFAGISIDGSFLTINTPFITASIFDTASSQGFLSGALDISGMVGMQPWDGITIGSRFNQDDLLNVKVGEIIGYDTALSPFDRISVQKHLSRKWGISIV